MTALWESGGAVEAAHFAREMAYAPRSEQQLMAAAVGTALGRSQAGKTGILMIEAGTGIGKTLAYLVPGAMHVARTGGRMMVSTHTLALATQIVGREGPTAINVATTTTGRHLRLAELRGRRNFPSASRSRAVANLLKRDGLPGSAWKLYEEIADRADAACRVARALLDRAGPEGELPAGAYGIVHDATFDALEENFGLDVPRDDIRLLPSCPDAETSVYDLGRRLATAAHILVTTHAMTATALVRRMLPGIVDATYDLLVLDEADLWPAAAAAVSIASVSLDSLTRSVQRLMEATRDVPSIRQLAVPGADLLTAIDELRAAAPARAGAAATLPNSAGVFGALWQIGTEMRRIADMAAAVPDRTASATGTLYAHCDEIDYAARVFGSNVGNDFWAVQWKTSRVTAAPSIVISPRVPGRLLKRVWTPAQGSQPLSRNVLLTSATLSTPGFAAASRWASIEIATGIPLDAFDLVHADLCMTLHPRKFGQLTLRFADPAAPVPHVGADGTADDAVAYAISVVGAARRAGGRVLVLVPSYSDVERYAALSGILLHQQGVALRDMLKLFRDDADACLVTPAGWVGLDLPGLISHLVIPRLPFPPRREDDSQKTNFVGVNATMLGKLAQGIGRAIRRPDDRATLWFADPRMPLPQALLDRILTDPSEPYAVTSAPTSNSAYLAAIPARFLSAAETDPAMIDIGVRIPSKPAPKRKEAKS
jgi:ATP-dependent DNA helicase DinG